MKKGLKTGLGLLAKVAMANAKKEADATCVCFAYQPKMPEKVKRLGREDGKLS